MTDVLKLVASLTIIGLVVSMPIVILPVIITFIQSLF